MKKFTHKLKTHFQNPGAIAILVILVFGALGLAFFIDDIFKNYNELNKQTDLENDAATITNIAHIQSLIGVYRIDNGTYPKSSQLCAQYEDIRDVLRGDVLTNNETTIYYCVDSVENPTQYRLVATLTTQGHQELDIDLDTNINAEQVGAYSCAENYCAGSEE